VEFTLLCPNDGEIDVGFEDVVAVTFVSSEKVEVVFACPSCGVPLHATLTMPNLLFAAMELARHAMDAEHTLPSEASVMRAPAVTGAQESPTLDPDAEERLERERRGAPYCEYFRRQLARVEDVEDFLSEIG